MEREHLHLLIHEEIYAISEESPVGTSSKADVAEQPLTEKTEATKEESPAPIDMPVRKTTKDEKHESPEIPDIKIGTIDALPFAVFHESKAPAEIELIHKIIDACQLAEEKYKIFGNGFDKSIDFKKALVFVSTAKKYYEPVPYNDSYFLCSQPADVLLKDLKQKVQLWDALKGFLDLS